MIQLTHQIFFAASMGVLLNGPPAFAAESNSRENLDVKTRAKISVAKSKIGASGTAINTTDDEANSGEGEPHLFDNNIDEEYDCSDLLIGVALGEVEEQYTLIEGTTSYDDGGCSE